LKIHANNGDFNTASSNRRFLCRIKLSPRMTTVSISVPPPLQTRVRQSCEFSSPHSHYPASLCPRLSICRHLCNQFTRTLCCLLRPTTQYLRNTTPLPQHADTEIAIASFVQNQTSTSLASPSRHGQTSPQGRARGESDTTGQSTRRLGVPSTFSAWHHRKKRE
jgi:hypothetical protein